MPSFSKIFLAAAASSATVMAQTFTNCNPTLKSGCPADPALASAVEYDFTQGAPSDFTASTGAAPTFDSEGGKFTISKSGEAPTLSSKWFMMFGHYDIVLKTAPGVGTVSTIVLQSDDLDEVDWEWLGSDPANVQTNYYGKGNTTVYDRGMTISNPGNQADFHMYSLDWTADAITWSVDGKEIRRLTPQTADYNQYPQSPMQLKIGTWAAGDPAEPQGTIQWAGGIIDYTKGPYTMVVKSVKAIDYSTGKSYSYGDQSGSWESIKSEGGSINGKGDKNQEVVVAQASGTAVADSTSVAALTQAPPTGTAVATGSAASGAQPSNGTVATTITAPAPGSAAPTDGSNSTLSASVTALGSSVPSGLAGISGSATSQLGPLPSTAAAGSLGSSVTATGFVAMLAAALLM